MTQKPSLGRIVHYVVGTGDHRAATIVDVCGGDILQLHVLLSSDDLITVARYNLGNGYVEISRLDHPKLAGDIAPKEVGDFYYPGGNSLLIYRPAQDEEAKAPGTWHWPERVD